MDDLEQSTFTMVCKYAVMALASLNILREIIQLLNSRLNYFDFENLIEWIAYIASLLLVIDWSGCQVNNSGVREVWQWQLGSVAILLAWLELVLLIRKIPRFGIFVVMFTDIFWTFLQFLPVFFLFIVAFGLTFFVLFGNQERFARMEWSLLSTFVMMIGELEYTDIFFGDSGVPKDTTEYFEKTVYYEHIAYAVFVIFLALLTILIMNLLVGLAVDDIKAVQEQAVLKRLAMQVELALDVESHFPQWIQRRFVRKCFKLAPNKQRSSFSTVLNLESTYMTSASIAKALDPPLDDIEQVQENQERLMQQFTGLRQRVKAMSQQNERLEGMLRQLMKAQGVEYAEEDVNEEDYNLYSVT